MNALNTCLILPLCLLGVTLFAQVTYYDFEDPNTVYPYWSGDTMDFEVRDGYLQLRDSTQGVSNVSLPTPMNANADTLVFELLLEIDAPPSDSNFFEVFILDSTQLYSGWFIQLGAQRKINIYYLDFDLRYLVMSGEENRLLDDSLRVRIRLESRISPESTIGWIYHDWFFSADYEGGRDFIAQDTSLIRAIRMDEVKIRTRHSANMKGRVRADDLRVESKFRIDSVGPQFLTAEFLNDYEVALTFDDTLDQVIARDLGNYELNLSDNELVSAAVSRDIVVLKMSQPFRSRESFSIDVRQITDDNGYTSRDISIPLRFILFSPSNEGSIVINELMVDPSPSVGLPEFEYIELYNPTNVSVYSPSSIASGGGAVSIPRDTLHGKEYLLLTSHEAARAYRAMGVRAVGFDMPALGNGGDGIVLGNRVLQYSRRWYDDPDRDGGGYSLEYIGSGDINSSCQWRASDDPSGGTPGRENSVSGWHDTIPPDIEEVTYSAELIRVVFDETVSFDSLDYQDFELSPSAPVYEVSTTISGELLLTTQLDSGVHYSLRLERVMYDCAGNYPLKPLFADLFLPGDTTTSSTFTTFGGYPSITFINPSFSVGNTDGWQVAFSGNRSSCALSGQVYDLNGRPIQELPPIVLGSGEGIVQWTGKSTLNSGFYSILFRLSSDHGPVRFLPHKVVVFR